MKNEEKRIKGNVAHSILKPLFKSVSDTDLEPVFGVYVDEFHLNEQ
jgi:hypothetical protein